MSIVIFKGRNKIKPDFKSAPDLKICPSKKSLGEKKNLGGKMSKKTFFLESAWNHGGMIDYGLTFTKRGRKPYLSLIGKEL